MLPCDRNSWQASRRVESQIEELYSSVDVQVLLSRDKHIKSGFVEEAHARGGELGD